MITKNTIESEIFSTYRLPNSTRIKFNKEQEMEDTLNLIVNMTIHEATKQELTKAIGYSIVVINAEKQNLDYRKAYQDFKISILHNKYDFLDN